MKKMFPKFIFVCFFVFLFCQNKQQEPTTKKNYKNFHEQARSYCKKNNLDTTYYFLLDLSIHSGKNRFFVIDLKTNKTTMQNLVTHGSCDVFIDNPHNWKKAKFSKKINSHCSMKGKYRVGKRDYSSWGIHVKYWLHGLESTNNTAVERVVVLHSWTAVKNKEIYPKYSPLSWGCPAVSDEFMTKLDTKLKDKKKDVLLWIVE